MIVKERTFQKKITIDNFKELKTNQLQYAGKANYGKSVREVATVLVEVFYTPKGYRCEIDMISPIYAWDFTGACRIQGMSEEFPDGDLQEKNFETMLAAMHFITRRLRNLGWEAVDSWHDGTR